MFKFIDIHYSLWSSIIIIRSQHYRIPRLCIQLARYLYLESGHTFLPNDTDFSKIETQLKFYERIYTEDEYMQVIKSCKKKNPLQVTKMAQENFLSSKNIEKNIVNRKTFINKEKINWLQTKVIVIKKEHMYIVYMKKDICT